MVPSQDKIKKRLREANKKTAEKYSNLSALKNTKAKKDAEKNSDADYDPNGEQGDKDMDQDDDDDDDDEGSTVGSEDSDLMEFSRNNVKVQYST